MHHDDVLGRLTEGEGRLDSLTAAELKRVPFRGSDERMMALGELCDLVGGRVTMLVELKSRFEGDTRLPARVADILAGYGGPGGADVVRSAPARGPAAKGAAARPRHRRGKIPAASVLGPDADVDAPRHGYLVTALTAQPQFVAYGIADLPALAPLFARHVLSMPLLTWAVRTPAERQRAARWADQMIFEGFRP